MFRTWRLACWMGLVGAVAACSTESGGSDATEHGSSEPSLSAADAAKLQQTLDDAVAHAVSPGVAARLDVPGYRAWEGTAGVADVDTGAPLTTKARFRAGSMLKTAVATAVLQLVEHDQLSLDAKVADLLPAELAQQVEAASLIDVRMLLEHTSGIPDFSDPDFEHAVMLDPRHVWTVDELLALAAMHPREFEPGAGWAYSNTDYTLLGKIIELTTGAPWRSVVAERVFARAGLTESALPAEGNALCDGCARGYEPIDGQLVDLTEVDPSMAGPAGGDAWITTPHDLSRLVGSLASGKLFDRPETLELMLDFVDANVPEWAQTGYGLGIARYQLGDTELIGHLGGTAGFHGLVMYHPGTGAIVSGYINANGDFGAFAVPLLQAVGEVLAK